MEDLAALQTPLLSLGTYGLTLDNNNPFLTSLRGPWHTDRSLHYTPIPVYCSLAARGCNAHAAAEYANPQPGGVSTEGMQPAEWFSKFFSRERCTAPFPIGVFGSPGQKRIGRASPNSKCANCTLFLNGIWDLGGSGPKGCSAPLFCVLGPVFGLPWPIVAPRPRRI